MLDYSKTSLTLVGSGIKFKSHLTVEVKNYIEQSDQVLYLVNEPAKSLENFYKNFLLRNDCYKAITEYILLTLRKGGHLCVVMYGHPTVFAKPGLDAVRQAKKEGYYIKVLPSVSAESCLYADLLIDPGSVGCQSFEATDFLIYRRKFDPTSHLILWQPDVIGVLTNPSEYENKIGLYLLVDYLSNFYEASHAIFVYEAAQYPNFEPRIENFKLKELPSIQLSSTSTLYVPPFGISLPDLEMLKKLDLKFS